MKIQKGLPVALAQAWMPLRPWLSSRVSQPAGSLSSTRSSMSTSTSRPSSSVKVRTLWRSPASASLQKPGTPGQPSWPWWRSFLSTCNWRPVRDYDRRAAADKAIADKLEQSTDRLKQILRSYEPSNPSRSSTKQFLHDVIQELSDSRQAEDLNP